MNKHYGKDFKSIINKCKIDYSINNDDINFYINKENKTFYDELIIKLLILLQNIFNNNISTYENEYKHYYLNLSSFDTCIQYVYITYDIITRNINRFKQLREDFLHDYLTKLNYFASVRSLIERLIEHDIKYKIIYENDANFIAFAITESCMNSCYKYKGIKKYLIPEEDDAYDKYAKELQIIINNLEEDNSTKELMIKYLNNMNMEVKYIKRCYNY